MKLELGIGEREKHLLLGALAVIILLLAYRFGFTTINDKATALNEEVSSLKSEYDKLYTMYTKEKFYKSEIATNTAVFEELLTHYPANKTQEFQIMFLDSLESNSTWISVYNIAKPTTDTTSSIADSLKLTGWTKPAVITFSATYDDVMRFLYNVNNNQYKTLIENISLTYNATDGTITGTANINTYAVVGDGRKPEVVNTTGVLIGRDNVSLFSSDTFSPNMSINDETTVTKIRNDNDLYVLVNPWGSSLDNVIVGLSKDNTGSTSISANGNTTHNVTITISGANGLYKASYKVGEQSVQATDFAAGETIDILLSSAARPDDVDLVGANVTIVNNSDKKVNFTVINDDKTKSRVKVEKSGDVVAY